MRLRRVLDAYSCAGGAGRGYQLAGAYVVGVDKDPQPRYAGDEFIQADALDVLRDRDFLATFDLIHASPPCHDHTPLTAVAGFDGTADLLPATRELLLAQQVPWVMENVPAASIRPDFLLCGKMFGLRVQRHRKFEIDPRLEFLISVPEHPRHKTLTATKNRRALWEQGWDVSVTGDVGVYLGPEALGIDWMTGNELSQAIPPAYTHYVAERLFEVLEVAA